jgi:hypothetical protein
LATIEQAIHSKLSGTVAIAAVVGTRIYQLKMPDNPTLPAITFEVSVGEQIESRDGYSDLSNPIVSIHCWGTTPAAVNALAILVRDAIIGQSWTYSGVTVSNVLEWSTASLYDSDTEIYHIACSCRVWYS